MKMAWSTFEDRVRGVAQLIWGRPAAPENIGGVDVDGVIHLDRQLSVLIEITEERTLFKVRGDIIKLQTAQNYLHAKRIIARSYCVIDAGSVTTAMVDAGKAGDIRVLTWNSFVKQFFDFQYYSLARLTSPFGSAVNPLTGERDDTEYVPVRYRVDNSGAEYGTKDIADRLKSGHHVILLGEYGSGKSRCVREIFRQLAATAEDDFCYPLAVDLRDAWGLKRWTELLRRHLDDLGLEALSPSVIKAFNAGAITILLDGFDELGSQAWNNDPVRLRAIRATALQGVKDVIQRCTAGVLVAGREHYFPSNDEMFNALGINPKSAIVIRSKEEFTDSELQEFFDQRGIDIDIPEWLPRRPLICQTINNLPEEDRNQMFEAGASETAFWDHFINVLCVRDARIHVAFDKDTIYGVLRRLGRYTRTRTSNVGPITLSDMQRAFEDTVGQPPGEEASVMLQRLPSLGRLGRDTDDRQFTDTYILDGLRAKDVAEIGMSSHEIIHDVLHTSWGNGLDSLGQRILASDARCSDNRLLSLAKEAAKSGNRVLASDAVGALTVRAADLMDFSKWELCEGHFIVLDLSKRDLANITFVRCTFGSVIFGDRSLENVRIIDSLSEKVIGATSAKGLPKWAALQSDSFESAENTASIKRIGLKPAQQILATTIRKTFLQKGAARKEEALTRGFTRIGSPNLIKKVLNLLIAEDVLVTSKGSEGTLYIPVRKHTGRMQSILDELATSKDPLWLAVSSM